MKAIIKAVLVMALVISNANAQEFQGIATYKTHTDIDIKMDSTKVNSEMQKQMLEMMKRQFQKTFKLSFNKEASIYKEEESLESPSVGGGDMQVMIMGSGGGSDILYKNTKSNSYTEQKDVGKVFLVKDKLAPIEWKLEKETKFIGQYQCFKATYVKMVEDFGDFKSGTTLEEIAKKEKKYKERKVTAWYTLQIPVNNGPVKYQGLPGLILEVHDGKLTIVCTKVVINPDDKVAVKEPSKGKEVTQAKFDEIMDKKNKEMMERYAPKKGNRDGEHIEFRIGG